MIKQVIRKLCDRWDARTFAIREIDFDDDEYDRKRPRHRRLLCALVAQAMRDGMTRIRIGYDAETGEPFMRYFGPVDSDGPIWWKMYPPTKTGFHAMEAWCLSLCEARPVTPPGGTIAATMNGEPVTLQFAQPDASSIELRWPEAMASRHKSGTSKE